MDSIRATIQRNRIEQLTGTLTPNKLSMRATLNALRVYPVLPVRRELNDKGGYTIIIGGANGE